jgi:hypothetical protein
MMSDHAGTPRCSHPLDAELLTDYWLAALGHTEEASVEDHLFACDDCHARLRSVVALAEGVRQLAREGTLRLVVSESFLQRASEQGLRVRQYTPPRGGSVACTVTADDDFLIARLAADMTGADRVDLGFYDPGGAEQFRLPDIPVHAGTSSVLFQSSIAWAKAAPSATMVARLIAVDERVGERLLGEYTFDHTRALPGPGTWLPPSGG